MNYFKDDKNNILSLEIGKVPPEGFEPITEEEVDAILNPARAFEQAKNERLISLSQQAQAAYTGGSTSEAGTEKAHFESAEEEQATLNTLHSDQQKPSLEGPQVDEGQSATGGVQEGGQKSKLTAWTKYLWMI